MSTVTREPGTDSLVGCVLAVIERFGRQFTDERGIHAATFTRFLHDWLAVGLNPGAVGNTAACTASFCRAVGTDEV